MKNLRYGMIAFIVMAATLACSITLGNGKTVAGSGKIISESRSVSKFTSIELAGSGNVTVQVGKPQSISVEADDNIVPLIETTVKGSKLVIGIKSNTSITTKQPIRITVTVEALDGVSITGSGNVTVKDLNADHINIELSGSGNITVEGSAKDLQVTLNGSGTIMTGDLKVESANVKLTGSGNITVNASQSLDANLSGSGTIKYRGNPPKVNQKVTGAGVINSIP